MKCSTCGAVRSHVGVMYPVRLLCKCEVKTCSECKGAATVVEFQSRIRDTEPANGVFYCTEHSPTAFEQLVPVANDSVPGAAEKPKRNEKNPHIDRNWTHKKSPPGAESKSRVQCSGCKDIHPMMKRRMFNGTNSNCPKCGDGMYTLDMETAA